MKNASKKSLLSAKIQLPTWCYGALLLIALVLFSSYGWLHHRLVVVPHQKIVADSLNNNAQQYLRGFNEHIKNQILVLTRLSQQPDTLTTLSINKEASSQWSNTARVLDMTSPQQKWAYKTKTQFLGANQLWLLGTDIKEFPLPRNFVAQRLYEQALQGKNPAPRAAKIDTWLVYIARPIIDNTHVTGALLIELKPRSLIDNSATTIQGKLALKQHVKTFPPARVAASTNGVLSPHTLELKTQIPHWQLQFTANRDLLIHIQTTPLTFYVVYGLLCLLAVIAAYFLMRKNIIQANTPTSKNRKSATTTSSTTSTATTSKNVALEPAPLSQLAASTTPNNDTATTPLTAAEAFPAHVFRDYDIRGKAGREINEHFANQLGKTLGTLALDENIHHLVVCADGRKSSPNLKTALMAGITSTGCHVIDIGQAPTPTMNFALCELDNCRSGVMITASHNPKEDNGFKIIFNNQVLDSKTITSLQKHMQAGKFASGNGDTQSQDMHQRYIERLADDVLPPTELHVVIDSGNGIAGAIAPQLFRRLGCTVTELFSRVDGDFPNHDPDPTTPANLETLIATVTANNADIGFAFDGDGDRLVAISQQGRIIWPDELLMIFARDIITRTPGADIVFDVKSTRRLADLVTSYGGRPVMWKTGHANIRRKMKETNAPVGGEFSGHIFFNDRWYGFDDGLYAAARLLEIMTLREQSLDDIVSSFAGTYYTPEIKIAVADSDKHALIAQFKQQATFDGAHVVSIDGLRVEYPEGWGLIRASNTSAALTLRFEANSSEALDDIMARIKEQLLAYQPELALNF